MSQRVGFQKQKPLYRGKRAYRITIPALPEELPLWTL